MSAVEGGTALSGRRSVALKVGYGTGQVAESVLYYTFTLFILFYYNQVQGLSGTYSGLALGIALIFDAISDPLAGSLSDNWKSKKLGRRHPFLYASVLPLCLTFYMLFNPPGDMDSVGLFIWLTVGIVLARTALTLFNVPYLSLGAELSDDYLERTSIAAWRQFIGHMAGLSILFVTFGIFFAATPEYPNGQLNPAAYDKFVWFALALMVPSVLIASFSTQKLVPQLPQAPAKPVPFSIQRILDELRVAFQVRSFRILFSGLVVFFAVNGVTSAYTMHMGTFFWNFGGGELLLYVFALYVGIFIGVPLAGLTGHWVEKHVMIMASMSLGTIINAVPVVGRIFGLMPENGDPMILPIVGGAALLAGILAGASLVAGDSMMGDISDEHELQSERRNEGIFFGARSFAAKASSGIGVLLGGVGLDIIGFPANAVPGEVPEDALNRLGLAAGAALIPIILWAVYILSKYPLTRLRHQQITKQLLDRQAN